MSFCSSASGRACLLDWSRPLAVDDFLTLLLELKRVRALAGKPLILIVVVRKEVPAPAHHLLTCLQATLPPILDCCQELIVAVEGVGADRHPLRVAFQNARLGEVQRNRTFVFDTLSIAFAHAQRAAPHDVLELQRHVLRQSFPPQLMTGNDGHE